MPLFTILSWNVETFGESKAKPDTINFLYRVIKEYDVDLCMFMETTKHHQSTVFHNLWHELNTIRKGVEWAPITSDPTGKELALPPVVPKRAGYDFDAFNKDLMFFYDFDEDSDSWILKPSISNDQIILPFERDAFGREMTKERVREFKVWEAQQALARLGMLKRDEETYTGLFRYNKFQNNYYLNPNVNVALLTSACLLVSKNDLGEELGYQDIKKIINGRCPFHVPIFIGLSDGKKIRVPIIFFHAPFGDSLGPRVQAINNLLNIGVSWGEENGINHEKLQNAGHAMILGDFNISYNPTIQTSRDAYGPLEAAGFSAMTYRPQPGDESNLSSLVPKADKKKISFNPIQDIVYRVNAYDNIFVKGFSSQVKDAKVLPLIWDLANLGNPGHYLNGFKGAHVSPAMDDAFQYYRTEISDHLPVLIRIELPARTW